jgi:hypothetical protein
MRELILLELLIGFLLLLPLLRPFIKGLRLQEGLIWLPALALLVCIGIAPAYGFRPECLPLFGYALAVNIQKGRALMLNRKRIYAALYDESLASLLVSLLFLSLGLGAALWFAPSAETALASDGVRSARLIDGARNYTLAVRVYEAPEPERPVILMAPPALGSAPAVDRLCVRLRENGFTVVSYSRLGFDMPAVLENGKRRAPALGTIMGTVGAFLSGTAREKPNQRGKEMEAGRRGDILFLLEALDNGSLGLARPSAVIAAAYDAGGSALILLASDPGFSAAHPAVKGIIAVESPLWSLYEAEPKAAPEKSGWWSGLAEGLAGLRPRPVRLNGSLPRPLIPSLFLASDKAASPKERNAEYAPLVRSLRLPESNAVLVAVEGAGVLDYTDYPAKYPLYSLLFSGRAKAAWADRDFTEGTAALMGNFAALAIGDPALERRETGLSGKTHIEPGGAWNVPNTRAILAP